MAIIPDPTANLSSTLADIGNKAGRVGFELGFNLLQNQVIERVNKEITKVNESASENKTEIQELQRRHTRLTNALPVIERYIFDTQTNGLRLGEIAADIVTLKDSFSAEGDATTVTAGEIAIFNSRRDALVEKFRLLTQLFHPRVTDGNVIAYLKNEITNLQALTPVAGTNQAANTTITTYLTTLRERALDAQETSLRAFAAAGELRQQIRRQVAEIQADFVEIASAEKAKKAADVQALQERFANVLQAISLSYEVRSGLFDSLATALKPRTIPPGSILSLFA
jgi:predicted nuclease with TOPRIM domain